MAHTAKKLLQDKKLRVTPVREQVLTALMTKGHALSASDIELAFDYVDRITLYRTLNTFEEKGLIHKVVDGTKVAKFAICEEHCDEGHHHDDHVHFHCEDCGNTYCVEEVEMPYIKIPADFKVKTTNIVLSGLCKNCD